MSPHEYHAARHADPDLKDLMKCGRCRKQFETCREKRQYQSKAKAEEAAVYYSTSTFSSNPDAGYEHGYGA